jgi:hypothetical protein
LDRPPSIDLVKELAKDATPPIVPGELVLIRRVVASRPDWLTTPELRHGLVAELFRQLALFDFEAVHGSTEWRTYLALHATFLSLADGQLRDEVRDILARSEQNRIALIAAAWERLAGLFGYRLRPELAITYETLATLLTASLRGLVIMALPVPGIAGYRTRARPFGAIEAAEWSQPALGAASLAWACLEPDPGVTWDRDRITRTRQALSQLTG